MENLDFLRQKFLSKSMHKGCPILSCYCTGAARDEQYKIFNGLSDQMIILCLLIFPGDKNNLIRYVCAMLEASLYFPSDLSKTSRLWK